MSNLRPNRKSGLGRFVRHGMLGKQKVYRNTEFKRVPEMTEEDKKKLILDGLKSYTYDEKKHIVVHARGPVEGAVPTPSITPTQTITPTPSATPPEQYYILTEGSDTITDESNNPLVQESAPDPTPTPTPTQTVTPSITPTYTPTSTQTPTPTPSGAGGFTPPSGIVAWYDLQDASNLTLNGNVIEGIADISGNGNDMIAYDAFGPLRGGVYSASTISGFNAAYYHNDAAGTGYAGYVYTPNPIGSSVNERTTFMVVAPFYNLSYGSLVGLKGATGSTSTSDRIFAMFSASQAGDNYGKTAKSRITSSNSYASNPPGLPLIYGVKESVPSSSYYFEAYSTDTTIVNTTLADNDNLSYNYIAFGRTSSTQNLGQGEVLEVLHWNSVLSTTDFNSVITYLRNKYSM